MQFNIIIRSVRTLHDINQGLCFHYKNMRGLNKLNKKSKLPGLKRKEQEKQELEETANLQSKPAHRFVIRLAPELGAPRLLPSRRINHSLPP